MESYLEIARHVLKRERRPMSARAILSAAYRAEIVPHHLHGKTQHKTLQARLSEDILKHKRNSLFYRTRPGHFFLTEFQADPSISEKFRIPFPARRRTRDLLKGPLLAVDLGSTPSHAVGDAAWRWLSNAFEEDHLLYRDPKEDVRQFAFLWTFAMVFRGNHVLSYRVGRYRDDRESFANKRTVGFANVVHANYRTLFNQDDHGILVSALTAALTDLDLSPSLELFNTEGSEPRLESICASDNPEGHPACVAFVRLECPDWFEPLTRRLSLNDLQWLDLSTPPNHIDDFDPWSRMIIESRSMAASQN